MHARTDFEYRVAQKRQERERQIAGMRSVSASVERPSIRRRVGESIIRFGQRVAATPGPAWSR